MKTLKELERIAQSTGPMTLAKYMKAADLRESMKGLKNPATVNAAMTQITKRHIQDCAEPIVIVLTGKKGSGKTTVSNWFAKQLNKHHYTTSVQPMAAPLKAVATSMGWNGEKDEKGRRLLQLLGTECGRNCISENIWIDKWIHTAKIANSKVTIIDDCRFDNEYDTAKFYADQIGAKFYHINLIGREEVTPDNRHWLAKLLFEHKTHVSEEGINRIPNREIVTTKCHITQSEELLEQMINE